MVVTNEQHCLRNMSNIKYLDATYSTFVMYRQFFILFGILTQLLFSCFK